MRTQKQRTPMATGRSRAQIAGVLPDYSETGWVPVEFTTTKRSVSRRAVFEDRNPSTRVGRVGGSSVRKEIYGNPPFDAAPPSRDAGILCELGGEIAAFCGSFVGQWWGPVIGWTGSLTMVLGFIRVGPYPKALEGLGLFGIVVAVFLTWRREYRRRPTKETQAEKFIRDATFRADMAKLTDGQKDELALLAISDENGERPSLVSIMNMTSLVVRENGVYRLGSATKARVKAWALDHMKDEFQRRRLLDAHSGSATISSSSRTDR